MKKTRDGWEPPVPLPKHCANVRRSGEHTPRWIADWVKAHPGHTDAAGPGRNLCLAVAGTAMATKVKVNIEATGWSR